MPVARIALIDYGAGNLASVRKALAACGAEVVAPAGPHDLQRVHAVIVPGVGHFQATRALAGAWRDAIAAFAARGGPLLGICLGMQWLFEGSEEAPDVPGLGVLDGRCRLLGARDATGETLKVPHVGWNTIEPRPGSRLLDGVAPGSYAYFTHSYVAPLTSACVATTMYGEAFASVVARDNVAGVQFHPEKSGEVGLRILSNFVKAA